MHTTIHPLISSYMTRHALPGDSVGEDGRLTVIIDDRYRVHLQTSAQNWLALSTRLCALPAAGAERDTLLLLLGRQTMGVLNQYDSSCVIDKSEKNVLLQQLVRPDSKVEDVEEAMGQFANALSFWLNVVRQAA